MASTVPYDSSMRYHRVDRDDGNRFVELHGDLPVTSQGENIHPFCTSVIFRLQHSILMRLAPSVPFAPCEQGSPF